MARDRSSARRSSPPDPARAALAAAIRAAYPHGVEAVIAVVDAAFTALSAEIHELREEVAELRRRLAADSTTSSKPPSTDVSRAVRPVSLRTRSRRRPGGQPGHRGETLAWCAHPGVIVQHWPATCTGCGGALTADESAHGGLQGASQGASQGAHVVECAQVVDLPRLALVTTEHQRLAVRCATCGHESVAAFPPGVSGRLQYGPELKALAVALHSYHLLPYARTAEVLDALVGDGTQHGPRAGSLARWTGDAAVGLAPLQQAAAVAISLSPSAHADETSLHVAGQRWWLHVAATATHTHLHVHRRRGLVGMEAAGVWLDFAGTLVHDGWWPNFQLGRAHDVPHQLCLAHLRREAKGLYALTQELGRPERWLAEFEQLFARLHRLVCRAAAAGRVALAPCTVRRLTARYDALLRTARRRHPYPVRGRDNSRPGRPRRGKVAAFADRLLKCRADVLRCAADATIPPDNNQAERDLRMARLAEKIAGGFRTPPGAAAFCTIRSALSTARKQGRTAIATLRAVFTPSMVLQPGRSG